MLAKNPRLHPYLVTAALAGILSLGFALRIANLSGPDFGVDEILHVFAAQQLMEGQPPLLPSGYSYSRSLLYTYTVALAGKLFGLHEGTARLSSVVFGCLTILLVFLITRQWYSNAAGLVAAFLIAISPMQIAFSRQVRMYALFQLLYLAFIFIFFQAFETSCQRYSKSPGLRKVINWCRSVEVNPLLFIVLVPLFLLNLHIHKLIIIALSGPLVYIVVMLIMSIYFVNFPTHIESKYKILNLILAFLGVYFIVSLFYGNTLSDYRSVLNLVPPYAQANAHNWRFYIYLLSSSFPIVLGTFMLASIFALTRNFKSTLYIMTCFAVPLLIHSFLLAWKRGDYIFHIIPLMFIIFSVGITSLIYNLYYMLKSWSDKELRSFTPRLIGAFLCLASIVYLLCTMPEFREGFKLHRINNGQFAGVQHFNWQSAMKYIEEHSNTSDIIITSRVLLSKYYGPELPLYFLNNSDLNLLLRESLFDSKGRALEYTGRAPIVIDLQMFREIIEKHPSGWFVTERFRLADSYSLPKGITQFIQNHLHLEDKPGAEDMAIWRWKPETQSGRVSTVSKSDE